MRVIMLYHPKSDHGGLVEDYAEEFLRYKRKKLELMSLESAEGAELARLYDVTAYPAVLVMSDEGSLQRLWQGRQLPLMDELSYYLPRQEAQVSHVGHLVMPTPA